MTYRNLWGREQWTRAISRECAEAGHTPIPCADHQKVIDEGVAAHQTLLDALPDVDAADLPVTPPQAQQPHAFESNEANGACVECSLVEADPIHG